MKFGNRLGFEVAGALVTLCLCSACGAVGPPIPPEDVGIEAKLQKQQKQDEKADASATLETPIEEDPVQLPPLRPIGSR
jgi:predicted small lipoprotein YifL